MRLMKCYLGGGNDIRLAFSAPRGLLGKFELPSESTDHPDVLPFMYKLFSFSFVQNDSFPEFERRRARRQEESSDRAVNCLASSFLGRFHIVEYLKDVFGFAEHEENATSAF